MLKLITCLILISFVCLIQARDRDNKSRARQNFYCNDILNEQIKHEFKAANTYLSLANYFGQDNVALPGFKHFFENSWKEELGHGKKLMDYVLLRGGVASVPAIPRPENDTVWSTMSVCEILQMTLNLEKKVNEHLHKVHKCGGGENSNNSTDPSFQDFIEREFLNEQFETNKYLADLLTELERATMSFKEDGSNFYTCNGRGLHKIDRQLSKKDD